jgi:hypothetical protein
MNEKSQPGMQQGDLSDRESVRTTFRFSKEALEALGLLSERHGVPMKDVLYFALVVSHFALKDSLNNNEQMVIKKDNAETIRRTVVITKKTLIYLNKLSKEYNVSRDNLINKAIIFTKLTTYSTDKSTIEVYQKAFNLIYNFYIEAQSVESKLRELLGDDDLIINEMELAVSGIITPYIKIEDEFKKREKFINARS